MGQSMLMCVLSEGTDVHCVLDHVPLMGTTTDEMRKGVENIGVEPVISPPPHRRKSWCYDIQKYRKRDEEELPFRQVEGMSTDLHEVQ